MDGWLLQDFCTISGNFTGGVASIPQSAHRYLDIGEHEDLVFYLDVRNFAATTGTVSMAYETAPTQEDQAFLPMVAPFALTGPGVRVDRAFFSTAGIPPARFVRWRLFLGGTPTGGVWDATFRVWVAAYSYA
jgi:hypothetical protein